MAIKFLINYIQRRFMPTNVPPFAIGKRRFRLAVETDAHKLVNYCCGLNYHIGEPSIKLKPDNEYPDWLWKLRITPKPNSWEMENGTKEYNLRLADDGRVGNFLLKMAQPNEKKIVDKDIRDREDHMRYKRHEACLGDSGFPQTPEQLKDLEDKAVSRASELVDEILQSGPNNVVALFDELSNSLCKVADLAEFIRVGHPNVRLKAAAEHASAAICGLVEQLNTDKRLYNALRTSTFEDKLDEHVAKLFIFDFEQNGIHLNDVERNKVLELNEDIIKLGSIFAANASQARLVNNEEIPASIRPIFSANDRFINSRNKSLVSGLYADSDNELVRETAYKTFLKPDQNQEEILANLLKSRLDLARLCGFQSYAHRAVKESIAGSPEVVVDFLGLLNDRLKNLAANDYDKMLQLKLADKNSRTKILNAWDVPYYSANYKRGIYNEEVVKCLPYFSLNSCLQGLKMIFEKLYGVTMRAEATKPGELWHNDVIKFSIIDEGSDTLLGHIYCDLFERVMKQNQDCHHTIRGGCRLRDGSRQLPIVVLVLSLPRPPDGGPLLLSPCMVDNLFHEMGHAMHSMMAQTRYQHITGTRCSTDLAEVPSILMEFFASDPRVVSQFARHHSTNELIPSELLQSWIKSKKLFTASETQLQLFYAALDQAYHSSSADLVNESTMDILARTQSQYYSIPYVENTAWQLRFAHLVSYGAKYYSYLVSRAVGMAIWTKLFAEDPLSRKAGEKFRRQVLAHGGGKPAKAIAEDVLECRVDADYIASSLIKAAGG